MRNPALTKLGSASLALFAGFPGLVNGTTYKYPLVLGSTDTTEEFVFYCAAHDATNNYIYALGYLASTVMGSAEQ